SIASRALVTVSRTFCAPAPASLVVPAREGPTGCGWSGSGHDGRLELVHACENYVGPGECILAGRIAAVRNREHPHRGRLRGEDAVAAVLDRGASPGLDAQA